MKKSKKKLNSKDGMAMIASDKSLEILTEDEFLVNKYT